MPKPILKSFTVEGTGEFPLDMLRSDRCWPASADDTKRVTARYCISDPALTRSQTVTLETSEKYAPNRQRWRSFGWRVID